MSFDLPTTTLSITHRPHRLEGSPSPSSPTLKGIHIRSRRGRLVSTSTITTPPPITPSPRGRPFLQTHGDLALDLARVGRVHQGELVLVMNDDFFHNKYIGGNEVTPSSPPSPLLHPHAHPPLPPPL